MRIIKYSFIVVFFILISGCSKNSCNKKVLHKTYPKIECYLNRINLKLALVSGNSSNKTLKIAKRKKTILFDTEENIYINKILLKKINNESELAAVLAIIQFYDNGKLELKFSDNLELAKKAIQTLVSAGFNPNGFLTIKNKISQSHSQDPSKWDKLNSMLSPKKSMDSLAIKKIIKKMPKDLCIGKQRYQRIIKNSRL